MTVTTYGYPKIKPPQRREVVRYVEPSIWDLRKERGPWCEWCNYRYSLGLQDYRNEAQQRHHCLIPDLKRFHASLTVRENLMGACMDCHTGECLLDTREVRLWFWSVQCARYGKDHMLEYLYKLDPKLWQSGRIDRTFLDGEVSMGVNGIGIDTAYK